MLARKPRRDLTGSHLMCQKVSTQFQLSLPVWLWVVLFLFPGLKTLIKTSSKSRLDLKYHMYDGGFS